jgi:hypothetical protein
VYRPRASTLPLAIRLLVPLVLGLGYLATRLHVFTIDSLYYLWDAEFASWRQLLHPHHLALEPIFRGWWRLWQWFGWSDRAIAPIQALNILTTLGGVALGGRLILTLACDRTTAVLWWLLLGGFYTTWFHATQAEGLPLYVLLATALLVWAAQLPRRDGPVDGRTAALVGATMVAAVLVHQALVLWTPLLAVMLAREAPPGQRWRHGAGTLAAAGAAVLVVYVIAGAWATGSVAPGDLWRWFTGYSDEFAGRCGSWRNLVSGATPRGLAGAMLSGTPLKPYVVGDRSADLALLVTVVPFVVLAGVITTGLLRLPRSLGEREPRRQRSAANVLVLVVLGALFAGWWEPTNRKFWAPVLPGLVALSAMGWSGLSWRWSRAAPAVLAATVALTVAFNLAGGILPRQRLHDGRQPLLMFLARSVRPTDAVIMPENRVWLAASYFRPGQLVHGLPGPRSDRDDPDHTVLQAAVADARRALAGGGVLYVTAAVWPAIRAALADEFGALPPPVPVLRFGDAVLSRDEQVLLAVTLPVG